MLDGGAACSSAPHVAEALYVDGIQYSREIVHLSSVIYEWCTGYRLVAGRIAC